MYTVLPNTCLFNMLAVFTSDDTPTEHQQLIEQVQHSIATTLEECNTHDGHEDANKQASTFNEHQGTLDYLLV